MASGHVNRTQRPNTWLHRPSLRREDSPCQLGAVHTWPKADILIASANVRSRANELERRRAARKALSDKPTRAARIDLTNAQLDALEERGYLDPDRRGDRGGLRQISPICRSYCASERVARPCLNRPRLSSHHTAK
jgi:hypothetical protein